MCLQRVPSCVCRCIGATACLLNGNGFLCVLGKRVNPVIPPSSRPHPAMLSFFIIIFYFSFAPFFSPRNTMYLYCCYFFLPSPLLGKQCILLIFIYIFLFIIFVSFLLLSPGYNVSLKRVFTRNFFFLTLD